MVEFIDQQRDEFDVESICRVLPIASSTYCAAKRRETAPSARAVRDAVMMQVLMVPWVANRKVYGAHKLWKAARRAGHDIDRDQVARLMRAMKIQASAASGARCLLPPVSSNAADGSWSGNRAATEEGALCHTDWVRSWSACC